MSVIAMESGLIECGQRTVRRACKCGRTDLYKVHRELADGTAGGDWQDDWCDAHATSWHVYMDKAGKLHECSQSSPSPIANGASGAKAPAPNGQAADMEMIATMLANALAPVLMQLGTLQATAIDPAQVNELIDAKLEGFADDIMASVNAMAKPTAIVEVRHRDNGTVKTITGAHKLLPEILDIMMAGEHVMLTGMAGTGKTTLASQVADALSLTLYEESLSPDMGRYALTGYMTATGVFISPQCYTWFQTGGVMHFDEFDNSNPSLLVTINAALANGRMTFADGHVITAHDDSYAMASANTYGLGADAIYVGRQAIDWSTLDRFTSIFVDVDLDVEQSMCEATGASAGQVREIVRFVRAIRKNASDQGIPVLFTPRGSRRACRMAKIGWDEKRILERALRRGMKDDVWNAVTKGVTPLRLP